MATASIPGFGARLYVATSVGAAQSKFGELADFTLNVAMGAMDATSKDSGGWKEHLSGLREWGGSGTGLYLLETTDAGQALAVGQIITNQAPLYLQLYEKSTASGNVTWTGNAILTGFDVESPLDAPAKVKITVKGTGALSKTATT